MSSDIKLRFKVKVKLRKCIPDILSVMSAIRERSLTSKGKSKVDFIPIDNDSFWISSTKISKITNFLEIFTLRKHFDISQEIAYFEKEGKKLSNIFSSFIWDERRTYSVERAILLFDENSLPERARKTLYYGGLTKMIFTRINDAEIEVGFYTNTFDKQVEELLLELFENKLNSAVFLEACL